MRKRKVFSRYDYERLFDVIRDKDSFPGQEVANIDTLKRDLERSRPVEPREIRPNVVTMNTKFLLKNIGNGKKYVYSLSFPYDCNDQEKINVLSAMGTQILGSTIGTVIKNNSCGEQYFIIDEILYQPEAAGDYYR
ncbi:MAG: GreA/GreB family elongation factor [Spirochaetes bacterium]|nr:GreA/GreB family elongation factor [Spirochaetota bacterium]